MPRRTKIIATIGPASDSPPVLRRLVEAGMDVARIGLAHGTLDDAMARYRSVRAVAAELEAPVGVLVDLPGPKVRLGTFGDNPVRLDTGSPLTLVPGLDTSDTAVLGVDYADLLLDVHPGDSLAVGDGSVVLGVESVDGDSAKATVLHGGPVQGRPGLHIPSDRLSMSTPTPEDLRLVDAFVDEGVDMVAISFVRSAHDIRRIGTEPHPRGPLIVAKIETRAAVENLQGIIEASGAIMIARGDLGTELGIEELPHLQKQITRDCISGGKPVITATQMFESMITSPSPTRAEVSDVANAIFDGTSAVMLSAESAVGEDPVNAVATMSRVAARADQEFDYDAWARRIRLLRKSAVGDSAEARLTDAMTAAAWRAATEMGVSAIICISETGFTVRSMARFRPAMPIIGFSPNERTQRQLTMSWGTIPLRAPHAVDSLGLMDDLVVATRDAGYVKTGEIVAVLAGVGSRSRSTDMLRLAQVP
ncbi:pyruvate kinase [Dermatobacter hominis]|uniref:pyruvate kinase n=1 Tax=Dermatobacter hominis TaxID=2884263 RepID=UPI001D11D896|nr:pyruvate kinase [Dermatobacter hominis]UDY36438.1 pyruvate kinase [Dermatobacter hominis]